jgi:ERCC4-type nuclease
MILCDIHEPDTIINLLKQITMADKQSLNTKGIADYFWFTVDNLRIQVERKQVTEILGGMDRVEEQLRRELPEADETYLLIEGIICPSEYGCEAYRRSWSNHQVLVKTRDYGTQLRPQVGLYSKYQAWRWQIDKAGISIYDTSCEEATAIAISAWYKNSQKEEHTTLKRYIRNKIYIEEYNPQVLNLMGIEGAKIGEVKAKALVAKYGTLYSIAMQPPEELCTTNGISINDAKRLLDCLGAPR